MAISKERKEAHEMEPYRGGRMLGMFDDMERMFDRYLRGMGPSWLPRVRMPEEFEGAYFDADIYEEGKNIVLKAELPGISKDELDIDITEEAITVSGEKKKEEKVEKKDYFRLERSYGSFTRTFRLPAGIKVDAAKATFKDGVLKIIAPRKEAGKKNNLTGSSWVHR
jgi:HSP20 family protein